MGQSSIDTHPSLFGTDRPFPEGHASHCLAAMFAIVPFSQLSKSTHPVCISFANEFSEQL